VQFQKAEEASRLAGLELDRAYWLLSAATVEFDLGNMQAAETHMTGALKLAEQLRDSPPSANVTKISPCSHFRTASLPGLMNG